MGGEDTGIADNKSGREDQAQNADDRQRERALLEALERGDEPRPPVENADLGDVDEALEEVEFPATAKDVVETVGDRVVERPTVAASMKRIVEASDGLRDRDRLGSQYDAYEKTLEALADIDADDEDEGVAVVTDWIVERIAGKGTRPGSRHVRKRAAKYCREQGFEIRDDQWLGA